MVKKNEWKDNPEKAMGWWKSKSLDGPLTAMSIAAGKTLKEKKFNPNMVGDKTIDLDVTRSHKEPGVWHLDRGLSEDIKKKYGIIGVIAKKEWLNDPQKAKNWCDMFPRTVGGYVVNKGFLGKNDDGVKGACAVDKRHLNGNDVKNPCMGGGFAVNATDLKAVENTVKANAEKDLAPRLRLEYYKQKHGFKHLPPACSDGKTHPAHKFKIKPKNVFNSESDKEIVEALSFRDGERNLYALLPSQCENYKQMFNLVDNENGYVVKLRHGTWGAKTEQYSGNVPSDSKGKSKVGLDGNVDSSDKQAIKSFRSTLKDLDGPVILCPVQWDGSNTDDARLEAGGNAARFDHKYVPTKCTYIGCAHSHGGQVEFHATQKKDTGNKGFDYFFSLNTPVLMDYDSRYKPNEEKLGQTYALFSAGDYTALKGRRIWNDGGVRKQPFSAETRVKMKNVRVQIIDKESKVHDPAHSETSLIMSKLLDIGRQRDFLESNDLRLVIGHDNKLYMWPADIDSPENQFDNQKQLNQLEKNQREYERNVGREKRKELCQIYNLTNNDLNTTPSRAQMVINDAMCPDGWLDITDSSVFQTMFMQDGESQ